VRYYFYLAFSKKHGTHFDKKYLWISCADHTVPYGDGSFEGRFSNHFVPGYDRCRPYGTLPFRVRGKELASGKADVTLTDATSAFAAPDLGEWFDPSFWS
jgi:hypothetical protein